MFGLSQLGRRLAEGVVGLFAILGFVYVPLGRHTGLQHARAVLSTPAAGAAIEDLTRAALDLRERAFAFISGRAGERPSFEPRAAQRPPRDAQKAPRPVPPKLN